MATVRKPMPPRYIAVPFSGTGSVIPIPDPTIAGTTISSSEVDLTITYVGPPTLLGYSFEIATAANGPFSPLASQTSSFFKATGLLSAITYFFRGRVQVTDGRFSNYTAVISKTTLAAPPAQPTGVIATSTGTTTTHVSWNSVVQADSYNVYRNGVKIANVPASGVQPQGILFSDTYSTMSVGNVSLTPEMTARGYSEFENSGIPGNVQVIARANLPAALLSNPKFSTDPNKQVLRFTLSASDIESRLLWSGTSNNPQQFLSLSWWEYRDQGNLGGEKFCRAGNFISGPGSNRGIDAVITLGQVTGTTLVANSANMHGFPDQSMQPGVTGWPGLHHYEVLYSLSTGLNANGSVTIFQDGAQIGQATALQFFDTTAQSLIGLQLWDTGGWSSTTGGTEGTVTYPIIRYFCEIRVATVQQGVWSMA